MWDNVLTNAPALLKTTPLGPSPHRYTEIITLLVTRVLKKRYIIYEVYSIIICFSPLSKLRQGQRWQRLTGGCLAGCCLEHKQKVKLRAARRKEETDDLGNHGSHSWRCRLELLPDSLSQHEHNTLSRLQVAFILWDCLGVLVLCKNSPCVASLFCCPSINKSWILPSGSGPERPKPGPSGPQGCTTRSTVLCPSNHSAWTPVSTQSMGLKTALSPLNS